MALARPSFRTIALSAALALVATSVGGIASTGPAAAETPPPQYQPLPAPQRIVDTRPGERTIDGDNQGTGQVAAQGTLVVEVAGRAGVDASAVAAVLNVTAVGAAGEGFLTVYPCDQDRPLSSNVNYGAGTVDSNAVFAALDADGRTCIYTWAAVDLVVDVNGWTPDGVFEPLDAPLRFADTRPGEQTIDGQLAGGGPVTGGQSLAVPVAGREGVPDDATSVVLNVTVTSPQGPGHFTVYPCDEDLPTASNLNYQPGQVTSNSSIARVAADGTVCVFTFATAHVIVDVSGSLAGDSFVGLDAPQRLVDSRPGERTTDGDVQGDGFRRAGTTLQFPVTGRADIPAEATAVALNVTVVNGAAPGFLTVHPRNSERPLASNVNFDVGQVKANLVVAGVGGGGMVCLYTLADVDVIVDVAGYYVGDEPADTGQDCPFEYPIRSLWDGYPVGEYHMPPGRYVAENPFEAQVWCEGRNKEGNTFQDFLDGDELYGSHVAADGRLLFDVLPISNFVDHVTVFGIDTTAPCLPLVPYDPAASANDPLLTTFGPGDHQVNVHIAPGTYSASRVPDGGFCVVLVLSDFSGTDDSIIARYQSGDDDSITISVPSSAAGITVGNTCTTFS